MKKILIIHTYGMGDMIMFTPALHLLREHMPQARIDVIVSQPVSAKVIEHMPGIGKIITSGVRAKQLLKTAFSLRKEHYDLSIVTSGGVIWKASLFSGLAGARKRVGEYEKTKSLFYTHNVKYREKAHRVENNIDILSVLDDKYYKYQGEVPGPQFYLSNDSMREAEVFLKEHGLSGKKLIGIHPGSNPDYKERRWPLNHFVELINRITTEKPDLGLLLFAGPSEKEVGSEIAKQTKALLVEKPLDVSAKLIKACDVFINTDSGLGHIASCFLVKINTIFGSSKPFKTRPYSPNTHVIKKDLTCQPCLNSRKKTKYNCNFECLRELGAEEVFNQIKAVL